MKIVQSIVEIATGREPKYTHNEHSAIALSPSKYKLMDIRREPVALMQPIAYSSIKEHASITATVWHLKGDEVGARVLLAETAVDHLLGLKNKLEGLTSTIN